MSIPLRIQFLQHRAMFASRQQIPFRFSHRQAVQSPRIRADKIDFRCHQPLLFHKHLFFRIRVRDSGLHPVNPCQLRPQTLSIGWFIRFPWIKNRKSQSAWWIIGHNIPGSIRALPATDIIPP